MNSTVRPIFNEKVTEKWNLWTHKPCTNILFTKDQGRVWIELIFVETENWNWKYCSKIIFKCVNSIVRPIFNKKVTEKCNLWDRKQCTYALFTVDKVNYCGLEKKKMKNVEEKRRRRFHCNPNGHQVNSCGWKEKKKKKGEMREIEKAAVDNHYPNPLKYWQLQSNRSHFVLFKFFFLR